tara:strand:+ start:135 stop:854 length:720 start_codon:yes stop_codon:yes gene_type:complete
VKLVILSGGLGTRLSEETHKIPKPMVKIGKMPIIWHIMQYYSYYGINDFIICGGYKYQIIKKFFSFKKNINSNWNVNVVNTGNNSNTGERIKRIKKYVDDTFLLTYGDGLSDINISKLIKFHRKFKGMVTLSSVKPVPKYGKILFKKNLIKRFYEKEQFREDWINGGFFVCNKDLFSYFTKKNSVFESDVLNRLAKKGHLQGYKHTGFWYCMDTLRDKNFLNDIYKKGFTPWIKWENKN